MPAYTNTSTDDVDLPSLGLRFKAGETLEVTDAQAQALGAEHPIVRPAAPAVTPPPVIQPAAPADPATIAAPADTTKGA